MDQLKEVPAVDASNQNVIVGSDKSQTTVTSADLLISKEIELGDKGSGDIRQPKKDTEEIKCIGMQAGKQNFGDVNHPKKYNTGTDTDKKKIPNKEDVGSKKYYGVSFPTEDLIQKDNPLIYEQKKDALQAIKQYPSARFREFSSRKEAYQYASVPYQTQETLSLSEISVRSVCNDVSKEELFELQKYIEDGDEADFLEQVWSNPRYLVNTSNNPTVIQEETGYNALHIAVSSGQTRMFVTILYVLQDNQFITMFFPNEDALMVQKCSRHFIDLYLNMPDIEFAETPLHLACRLGHDFIVQIMLSFSYCNTRLLNKFRKSAKDIICENHDCFPDHKKKILYLFEVPEFYYVPFVQDEVHKYVSQPCDARTFLTAVTTHPLKEGTSATYCAFAGPATRLRAIRFYNDLKRYNYVLLKDQYIFGVSSSQKRLERDGRKLSKSFLFGWIEYWESLHAWLDISSPKCLSHLNKHLYKLDVEINILPRGTELFMNFVKNFIQDFNLCEIVASSEELYFFQQLQFLSTHMYCFIDYSFSEECEVVNIHEELGHILYLKLTEDNHINIESFLILKLFLLRPFNYLGSYQKLQWKMLRCILKFAFFFQQANGLLVMKPQCSCSFVTLEEKYTYSSQSCFYKLLSWRQEITNEMVQKYKWEMETPLPGTSISPQPDSTVLDTADQSRDEHEYSTSTSTSPVDEFTNTSPPKKKPIYVGGEVLKDEDVDVLQVLLDAKVNINEYNHILKWTNMMIPIQAKMKKAALTKKRISHAAFM